MSEYEARGGDWDGHGDPPAWVTGNPPRGAVRYGCGCAACEANGPAKRHHGEDGGQHHLPYLADDPDSGDNPYELLRQLNNSRRDPLTAREEARQEYASEHAEPALRDGPDLELELRRYRNFDGGNLSGSAAREIVRATEFRAVS